MNITTGFILKYSLDILRRLKKGLTNLLKFK